MSESVKQIARASSPAGEADELGLGIWCDEEIVHAPQSRSDESIAANGITPKRRQDSEPISFILISVTCSAKGGDPWLYWPKVLSKNG
jgi:hypothetical protein